MAPHCAKSWRRTANSEPSTLLAAFAFRVPCVTDYSLPVPCCRHRALLVTSSFIAE